MGGGGGGGAGDDFNVFVETCTGTTTKITSGRVTALAGNCALENANIRSAIDFLYALGCNELGDRFMLVYFVNFGNFEIHSVHSGFGERGIAPETIPCGVFTNGVF